MGIRFKYGGVSFTADTPQEAAQTMALLKERDAQTARDRALSRYLGKHGGMLDQLRFMAEEEAANEAPSWTPEVFLAFIDRLGKGQREALGVMVTHRRISDDELRRVLKKSNNQALAGVLSGISKQAAALKIPARAIFSFENLRNAGKRRSTYTVADKFLQIATNMNWPASAARSNPSSIT